MTGKTGKYHGSLMAEMIVALTVLAVLLVMFAISLAGFRKLNHYHLVKQRCISAAQATLDSYAVTGTAIDQNDFDRLWPDVNVQIEESDGMGQWKGLKLITVTASGVSFRNKPGVSLSRYFPKDYISTGTARRLSALQEQ
jgi:type II secretory pathway pseudopilin PulG